jgi:hypothetical protein
MSTPADQMQPTPPSGYDPMQGLQADRAATEAELSGLEQQKGMYQQEARDEQGNLVRLQHEETSQLAKLNETLMKPFEAAQPKFNMQTMMQSAPIWTAIAALAGSRGRTMGIAGISALNGMMKGLVQGDLTQYQAAEKRYSDAQANWHQYASNVRAIAAELQKAYGTDKLAAERAAQAALRASGATDVAIGKAHQILKTIDQSSKQLQINQQKADDAARAKAAALAEKTKKDEADAAAKQQALDLKKQEIDRKVQSATARDRDAVIADLTKQAKNILAQYPPPKKPHPEQQAELDAINKGIHQIVTGRLEEAQPKATPQPSTGAPAAAGDLPQPGEVRDGFRFKGGAPSDPKNWEKVSG